MLRDKDFKTVYLSEYLKTPTSIHDQDLASIYIGLEQALTRNGYQPKLLPYKDRTVMGGELSIWCRDYMPVHTNHNNFLRFGYEPNYLKYKKYKGHIPDSGWVVEQIGAEPPLDFSVDDPLMTPGHRIILDGGNVVSCGDKVIMTKKIFEENPQFKGEEFELRDILEQYFSAKIVLLPWDKREIFGHTDGIARYLSGNQIVYNTYGSPKTNRLDRKYNEEFRRILTDDYDFELLTLDFSDIDEDEDEKAKYCWAYVNWLQLKGLIIVPSFKSLPKCNEYARKMIEKFTCRFQPKIEMVEASALVKRGGGFNCASWTY